MLYIKFNISAIHKYQDFQKLYRYLDELREKSETTWEETLEEWETPGKYQDQDFWEKLMPAYARSFLGGYFAGDITKRELSSTDLSSIANYLEFGFEVDFDELTLFNPKEGQVNFTALGFPYGGMQRFLMVLKAYGLLPVECYNGFTVYAFDWTTPFDHEPIELPEKTKIYLQQK